MTLYKYRAVDDEGSAVEGTMDETSAHRVTQRLRERGLSVSGVEEMHKDRGLIRVSNRLTWDELNLFTEQLVSIARSELPLAPALKAMAADLRNPRMKAVMDGLQHDLERGETLEQAVTNRHDSFPRLFPSIIRAGEATGNLAGVLQLLSSYTVRMVGFKNTLHVALAYPVMVLFVASFVVGFMLVKVVPVFAEIFSEFGGELPMPTQFWIAVGDYVRYGWPNLLMAACGLVAAVHLGRRLLRRSESGRCWLDWFRLHTPLLGRMHYLMALGRFCRTLGLLLASRVPVLESLELAAAASGSPLLQRAAEEASLQVAGGDRIADALAATGFFGHNLCWLLATGEERGQAEVALDSLAGTFDREVATRDRVFGLMASPVIIICVALIVASIIISLYLPIFTLGDMISGS